MSIHYPECQSNWLDEEQCDCHQIEQEYYRAELDAENERHERALEEIGYGR